MKPFNLFITDLNGGETNAALSAHLAELMRSVKTHGRPGTLKVSIKVSPATKGSGDIDKILVGCDSQLSLPKPEQPTDMFFLDEDAEPSRKHPRQRELQLSDVSSHGATNAALTPEAALAVAVANGAPVKFTAPDADGVINPLTLKDATQ